MDSTIENPLIKRNMERLDTVPTEPFFDLCASICQRAPDTFSDPEKLRAELLALKHQVQIAYIENDFPPLHDEYDAVGKAWTQVADWSLQTAYQWAWQTTRIKKQWQHQAVEIPVPGVFILGMGKLGGCDLNFSSDVDLISFYVPESIPTLPYEGKTDVAANVNRAIIKYIDGETMDGQFVWRTDFRLRPDPSVTDLAMSDEAALNYFFFNSAPWRRLAMMKSRLVAGDIAAGQKFLEDLEPFIWRRHIDYTAIDEIASIKQRIHVEHPGLSSERVVDDPLSTAEGFNVKLGRGGIREIEFIVNAQQLLWGGRDKNLRTTHTMSALKALTDQGYLPADDYNILSSSYVFFRQLENRIQYFEDKHTHLIFEHPEQRGWLAMRSGFSSWDALASEIIERRQAVNERFENLFAENEARITPTKSLADKSDLDTLEKPAAKIAQAWQNGFHNYSGYQEVHKDFADLANRLIDLAFAQPEPSVAIMKLHNLFKSLGIATSYLRLLAQHEHLQQNALFPFLYSESLSVLLEQSPHVLDGLLSNGGHLPDEPDVELGQTMVFAPNAYENRLEALRAYTNEQLYLVCLNVFNDNLAPEGAEKYLSTLAEVVVRLAADIVAADNGLEKEGLPFCVLALGKLGMERMTPMSDLDLIFICDDGLDIDLANKLSRKLQTALNAQMREGRAYEIDMRLRPSGASGPPTVSLASFKTHHLGGRARTWEQLALVPARVIYGKADARGAVETVIDEIRSKGRNKQQLANDSYKMLTRLRAERIQNVEPDSLEIKLRSGGLMETEYLITYLILKMAPENPELLKLTFDDAVGHLSSIDADLLGIKEALRFWRNSLFYRRLIGLDNLAILRETDTNKPDAISEKKAIQHFNSEYAVDAVRHAEFILAKIKDEIFETANISDGELEDYREQPIEWL